MKKATAATVEQAPMMRIVTSEPARRKKVYTSALSANGQITIPKELRDDLALHPGDTLILTPRQDSFAIHKRKSLREEMTEWRNGLSPKTNKIIEKTAGWTLSQYHEYFDNLPENVAKMEREYGLKES